MSHVTLAMDSSVAIVTTANPPAELFEQGQITGLQDALEKATKRGARAMVIKSDATLFSGGADAGDVFYGKVLLDVSEAQKP